MRGSLLKRGETWSYVLYLGRGPDGTKQQSGSADSAPGGRPKQR
jgi:hypothetical protein